ncbi:MAG: MFS transporter [Steroidobacteraceae bacterium]
MSSNPIATAAANAHTVTAESRHAPLARTTGYAWYVAGTLAFAYMLSILDRYLLSVLLEDIKRDLELTDTQLGILLGPSFVLLFLLASIPLGRLADVASRRIIIAAGLGGWSLATIGCSLADSYTELLLARLAVGLGEAALLPSAMSLIGAYFTRDKLNRGCSIFAMGASFGRAAAFAGGGALFAWFAMRGGLQLPWTIRFAPWQGVFLTAGVIGLCFAGIFLLTVREPPRAASAGDKPSLRDGLGWFWQHYRAYLSIFIPYSMTSGVAALLAGWSVSFYVRNHHLDVATASMLVGITGVIFGPIGALSGGWLNDHLRARGNRGPQPTVLAVTLVLATLCVVVFALAPSVIVAAAAYACAYALLVLGGPTGLGGTQLLTPEPYRGVMSSIFLIVYMAIGTGIAPLLVGVFVDHLFRSESMLGQSIILTIVLMTTSALPFALTGRPHFVAAVQANESSEPR